MFERGFKASRLFKQTTDMVHALVTRPINYNIILICLQLFCIGFAKLVVLYHITYDTNLICTHDFTIILYL